MPKREDDHLYVTGQRDASGHLICGSRRSIYPRDKRPCGSRFVMANGRCRNHGGETPAGIASPNFKTGRYSKHLPTGLQDRYHAALEDDTLLTLTDEIALLDARLSQLIERVDTGEAGSLWKAAKGAFADLQLWMQTKNSELMSEALSELSGILGRGTSDYAAWESIQSTIQQRRALVESQRKREIELQLNLSIVSATEMATYLGLSIHKHANLIPPGIREEFLALVVRDMQRVFSQHPAQLTIAGSLAEPD